MPVEGHDPAIGRHRYGDSPQLSYRRQAGNYLEADFWTSEAVPEWPANAVTETSYHHADNRSVKTRTQQTEGATAWWTKHLSTLQCLPMISNAV